jgi:hypothetical protein
MGLPEGFISNAASDNLSHNTDGDASITYHY